MRPVDWVRFIGPIACVAYCVVNLVLNIMNGWIFLKSSFRFPLSLTVIHMWAGFFFTWALFRVRVKTCVSDLFVQQKLPGTSSTTKKMALLGLLAGLNIAFNNVSLLFINVALNQIVKAFNPVLIAISDVLLRGASYSPRVWSGFVCITVGVMLTVFNNPHFNFYGFVFCCLSSIVAAFQTTLAENLMTEDLKLDVSNFMYYTSLWSAFFIFPLAAYWDLDLFLSQLQERSGWLFIMVIITSILAFFNNTTLLLCIKFTSGTYSGVVGNVKIVLIVILQHLIWPEDAKALQLIHWFGMILTLLSFTGISMNKLKPSATTQQSSSSSSDTTTDQKLLTTTTASSTAATTASFSSSTSSTLTAVVVGPTNNNNNNNNNKLTSNNKMNISSENLESFQLLSVVVEEREKEKSKYFLSSSSTKTVVD